jgi:membrane associated rhomboid family serine protease
MAYNNQNNYHRPSMFGGFQFFPPVIKVLLIINGLVFFFANLFLGAFRIGDVPLMDVFWKAFALIPVGQGFFPWQLITYQFLHGGFLHLFFNMLALWMFGMELENSWGSKKFLIYYLSCGVFAGMADLFIAPLFTSVGPTVGASGSIYAVLLAFGMIFPDRLIFMIPIPIPIKAKYFVSFYILLEIISVGNVDGVAHMAHLGGAFAGLLYILYDRYRLRIRSSASVSDQSWGSSRSWSHPKSTSGDIVDAKIYDIKESASFDTKQKPDDHQKKIDDILDKISRSGYQSLTEDEKKTLFEASKRMN